MNERNSIIGKIDWVTVLIYLALVMIGWFSIFSARYNEAHPSIFDLTQVYGKQLLWIGGALLVGFVILLIDAKFFNVFSLWIYIFFLFCLFAVLVYGTATKGATAWIDLGGGVKLQPSEFAKMATALAVAGYLDRLDVDLQKRKDQIVTAALILIPMALVLLQNDTGSAIVFVSFIFVLYREGFPGAGWVMVAGVTAILLFVFTLVWSQKVMYIILGVLLVLTLTYYLITRKKGIVKMLGVFAIAFMFVFSVDYAFNKVLQEHQKNRILVLLGQLDDPKGVGYNVHQSKIAIGSGGFAGKHHRRRRRLLGHQHRGAAICSALDTNHHPRRATTIDIQPCVWLRHRGHLVCPRGHQYRHDDRLGARHRHPPALPELRRVEYAGVHHDAGDLRETGCQSIERIMNDFFAVGKNNHSYTEVTPKFLTSNSPRSLIFSSGMTSNAMNAKVINGAYSVDPRRLASASAFW